MFSRSRKRIILSIMVSLILLLAVTLSVIMLASYREIWQRDSEMLTRYAELYSLDQGKTDYNPGPLPEARPDQEGPPPNERPDYQLSTFYSVAIDENGNILAVNNDAKGLYEEDELIGIARDLLEEGKSAGRLDNLSYLVRDKNGYTLAAFIDNTVTASSMKTLLRNVLIIGGAAVIAMFFISLFLAKRIIRPLEENDEQQKQFISDASHELKTPVAVISANAELLFRELGENEWLANIQYENERMGDLVKQLLDLSRTENTKLAKEDIDFSRVVTGEVLAFESLAFDQGKRIQSDIEDGIHISGSQTQLTQLASVLLDNAIQHSSGGEIEVSLKQQGHMAALSVVNEGAAIPSEKQEHLFDRFYRVDEARNNESHHYGLGLSIAKAVAEKHEGNIRVSYHDGKVCFIASLPIKKL